MNFLLVKVVIRTTAMQKRMTDTFWVGVARVEFTQVHDCLCTENQPELCRAHVDNPGRVSVHPPKQQRRMAACPRDPDPQFDDVTAALSFV